MEITQLILFTLYLINLGQCQMEPYIVNGQKANIEQFPYSALLSIDCKDKNGYSSIYLCGSSIINQFLLLTAAHCTDSCEKNTLITAFVGHALKFHGASSTAHSFLQHEHFNIYDEVNDIALVRLNTRLEFSQTVSRVALMENPPYDEEALIAGWGASEIHYHEASDQLYYLPQQVKKGEECPERGDDPTVFCTITKNNAYPYFGDTGSALVVRNYIQIGIASFQYLHKDSQSKYDYPAVTFYTDTGYFYNWIQEKSIYIMCFDGGPFPNATSDCIIARDYSGKQNGVKKIV